jgi:hypothetical protein
MTRPAVLWRGIACVVLALSISSSAAAASQSETHEWRFKVLADGRPIGTHVFRVTADAESQSVETQAHFKVKAAFITLFHYDHEDHESLKDGCLQRIDADTNDDGKQYHVHGHLEQAGLSMGAPQAGTVLRGCIHTFAYWDKRFLEQKHLLNAQTGVYTAVNAVHSRGEQIIVAGKEVQSDHCTLTTQEFTMELWYSKDGDWLSLQTTTQNGHRLRYDLMR